MKILILSCNTGEGHNSTAAAVREYLEEKRITCDVEDALAFLSPYLSSLISGAHVFTYRNLPRVFNSGYRMEEKHLQKHLLNTVFGESDALRQFILDGRYDGVICVHAFAGLMMTSLRRKHELLIPQFFVATDYTCSPSVDELDMDIWFIPHEKLRAEFVACGVPAERIVVSGIPVRRRFLREKDTAAARRALALPQSGGVVLLCCGSMGCGPMVKLAEQFSLTLPPDSTVVTVCGTNERLRRQMEERQCPNERVLGFTEQMADYMDAADLYVTKAGGLSTTEAVMKGVALLYVDAVGGCEARNAAFMAENGYALCGESNEALAEIAADCLLHPRRMEETLRRRGDFCRTAAQTLCESVLACITDFGARRAELERQKPYVKTRRWVPGMKI